LEDGTVIEDVPIKPTAKPGASSKPGMNNDNVKMLVIRTL